MTTLNRALREWEQVYNQIRPHRSLANLTPRSALAVLTPTCLNPPPCLTCGGAMEPPRFTAKTHKETSLVPFDRRAKMAVI